MKGFLCKDAVTKMQAILMAVVVVVAAIAGAYYYYVTLTPEHAPSEILVGTSLSMSGLYAKYGGTYLRAYTMWVSDVNSKGGIYVAEYGKRIPVKLIWYDDNSDPTTAAKLYEKLITLDNVHIVLSPYSTAIISSVAAICEKYHKVLLATCCSSDPVYQRGLQYLFNSFLASKFLTSLAEIVVPKLNPPLKKIAVCNSKTLYAQIQAQSGKALLEKAGCETVLYEEWESGIKDFTPLLLRIKSLNVDGLIAITTYEEAVLMTRQLIEINWRPKLLYINDAPFFKEYRDTFGNLVEGIVNKYDVYYANTTEAKDFVKRYTDLYGEYPNEPYCGLEYASCQVLEQAIEKAGTLNNEKIREVLLANEFPTIMMTYKFASFGNYTNINIGWVGGTGQIQNGKFILIAPPEVKQADIIYPLSETWT